MKKYLIVLFSVFALTACENRLSTADLTSEVITSMEAFFSESNPGAMTIEGLILTRNAEGSNQYTGILTTTEPAGAFTYEVDVTYDGENMTWMIVD